MKNESGCIVLHVSVVWLILHIVAGEGQLLYCMMCGVLVTSAVVSHDDGSQHAC